MDATRSPWLRDILLSADVPLNRLGPTGYMLMKRIALLFAALVAIPCAFAADVEMTGGRVTTILGKCKKEDLRISGDVFIDTTGTAGPPANCNKYGNGCAMCVLRCHSYGGRVSLAAMKTLMIISGAFGVFPNRRERSRPGAGTSGIRHQDPTILQPCKIHITYSTMQGLILYFWK